MLNKQSSLRLIFGLVVALFASGYYNHAYALSAPTLIDPTIGMAQVQVNGAVKITWKDNSTDETKYRLQRWADSDANPSWKDLAANLSPNTQSFVDSTVVEGSPYTYRVRAEKGTATTVYLQSNKVRPLKAPSLVSVTRNSSGQPVITWNDNSAAETGYVIERRDDGTGDWQSFPTKTAKNIKTYTDTDVIALIDPAINRVFEYRVKAYISGTVNYYSQPTSASGWLSNCSTLVSDPWLRWMNFLDAQVPPNDANNNYRPVWGKAEPARTRATSYDSFAHPTLGLVGLLYNNRYAALFVKGALVDVMDRDQGRGFFGAPYTTTGIPEKHLTSPTIWQIAVGSPQDSSPEVAADPALADRPVIWSYLSSIVGNPITEWNQQQETLTFRWAGPAGTGIEVPNKTVGTTPSTLMVENVWQIFDSASSDSTRKDSSGVHGRMQVTGMPPANEGLIYVRFPFLNHLAMYPSDRNTDLVMPSEEVGNVYRNFPQPNQSNIYRGTLLEGSWQAPFFGVIQDDAALYIGVEDPKHHPKSLYFRNQVGVDAINGTFIEMYPESIDPPDNQNFAMDHHVVLTPMCVTSTSHGANGGDDWVRIAKRYRDFATGSRSWLRKDSSTPPAVAKLSNRNDIPQAARDGLYWWTEWMGAYNQYGDGLNRDLARYSTLAQSGGGIVKDTSTNKDYHSLYKEISPYADARGCYLYQESAVKYYVFANNAVDYTGPNRWGPGTDDQRIYLGGVTGHPFTLLGGRVLSSMFVGEANSSRSVFQANIADKRTVMGFTGQTLPVGFHTYTWHTPGFDRGNPEYTMIPGFESVVTDANASCSATSTQPCDFILPYINASVIDMTDWNWSSGLPGNPVYGKYCLYGSAMTVLHPSDPNFGSHGGLSYLWPSITGQSIGRLSIGSSWWRGELLNITNTVFNTIGARGIYLDTFGGHYDPSFREDGDGGDHPRGYGVWYTDRYQQVAKSIKDMATDASPRLVAAEHGSDAYFADIDMVMLYGETDPAYGADVMPAIYSGYKLYAGTRSDNGETIDGAATKSARHFVSGRQVGLNAKHELGTSSAISSKVSYATILADARLKLKDILSYGEYLGPADPNVQNASTTTLAVSWCVDVNHECAVTKNVTLPAIRGSRWQFNDPTTGAKKRAIVLTNASSNINGATGNIPIPNSWAPVTPQLCDPGLTSCSSAPVTVSGSSAYVYVSLPPQSVRVLLF